MRLYDYSGRPCWLHYIGGYVSLSTATEDILQSPPNRLAPFERKRTSRVKVGEHTIVTPELGTEKYELPDGRVGTREIVVGETAEIDPVYESVTHDVTPEARVMGTPIKVGDSVALLGRGHPIKGTLTDLTDVYAKIDDTYYFWANQQIAIIRPKDVRPRR